MSPRVPRPIVLLLALAVAAPAAIATAQEERSRTPRDEVIDLTFPGGPAPAYVTAVRRAAGDLNVMTSPDLSAVTVQPVELKRVSIESALRLLEGRYPAAGRSIEVQLAVDPARSPAALSVYRIDTRVRTEAVRRDDASGVWSLADAIAAGLKPEAVLTAVETALGLYDDAYGAAELRFHRDSGLLIARAHPEQIQTISLVLDRLPYPARESEAAAARIAQLEVDVRDRTTEVEQMHRRMVELATRSEMLEQQIRELRAERSDLGKQVTTLQIERDTTVSRYQAEVDKLTRMLEERRKP